MIKPEFFDDPDMADVSLAARLFFIGLWTQADKEGRLEDDMRRLKARIFPFDEVDCEALAVELHGKDMIRRYKTGLAVEKHGYIWIRNFTRHQRPHPKEPASLIPACENGAGKKHGEPGKNTAKPSDPNSGSLSLSTEAGERKTESAPSAPRAPLHQTHKNHAACGRVCVPAQLHSEFVRRRNHDGADAELRAWYLRVDEVWSTGANRDWEPGDTFAFWKARYDEQWPAAAKVPQDRTPAYQGWTCPHVEECSHRAMCANKLTLGTAKYPVKAEAR